MLNKLKLKSELTTMNILAIIPARGGSKGIPRKNLRTLANNPLIYYSIMTALNSKYNIDLYVSSDDDEILSISKQIGAKVIKRDETIAKDITTLDPVIYDAYIKAQLVEKKEYDLIITLQPTSPLLKTQSLDKAIEILINNENIDTIISATDDTHLTWRKENNRFYPNYEERVNRQYLTPTFKETGGFLITRSTIISQENRIGENVELYLLSNGENIDIDTYEDWSLCEYSLRRKRILFVVSGYAEIGLGHVYNSLLIANDILEHEIEFLVDKKSQMAFDKIASKNYKVSIQTHNSITEDIKHINPDVVINDCLDTEKSYITPLKERGIKVINFEDLGTGAKEADLVINAIYPEKEILSKHYFGHNYYLLRDEFLLTKLKETQQKVKDILLTFGGVDPNNYTYKVIEAIYEYCKDLNIEITVVAGFGYTKFDTLKKFKEIKVYKNATNIAEHMNRADIIFTSAGRTIYEVASMQTPAIVLAQNERELTHFFASSEYGFLNLGLGYNLSNEEILENFKRLVESFEARKYMSELMQKVDLNSGRRRVMNLIKKIIEEER